MRFSRLLLGVLLVAAISVALTGLSARGSAHSALGWRHPTTVELAHIRKAIHAWACQAHPSCYVAVPAQLVRVAKRVDSVWGVYYATAVLRLAGEQGETVLLSRGATVPANGYHGSERGSPWWWVFGVTPYGGAKVSVRGSELIASAACKEIKRELRTVPEGC